MAAAAEVSQQITLRRPDDAHLHLRDGAALAAVVAFSAERFARAVVMPNLTPPVTTTALALSYRERIRAALPPRSQFQPLMTLYLTDRTGPDEIERASRSGAIAGCKLYPAGATTHSDSGVTDITRLEPAFEAMMRVDLPLQVHGEVTDPRIDVFDREARFIERVLAPLCERWPKLRVVFEHVTTREAVNFVRTSRAGVAATVTPQHLLHNRNALFAGGIRPHFYCLPLLKTEPDRLSLLETLAEGDRRFFLGTDSAPHARHAKETACGCAGIFSAHAAIELYAEIFESEGMLSRLPGFASEFAADFYRWPRTEASITLVKQPWTVPASYPFAGGELVPMRAGEPVGWQLRPEQ
jgi:dihydroorotase